MKIKKPKKHSRKPLYDWNEIVKYLEEKYEIKLRDYKPKDPPRGNEKYDFNDKKEVYRDFWHHLLDIHEIHNGCSITIEPNGFIPYLKKPEEWWIKEIYELLLKEFGEEIECEVSW